MPPENLVELRPWSDLYLPVKSMSIFSCFWKCCRQVIVCLSIYGNHDSLIVLHGQRFPMITREFTHSYDSANGTRMIHETTQRPRSENVSLDTCILETTGLRGSSIGREN